MTRGSVVNAASGDTLALWANLTTPAGTTYQFANTDATWSPGVNNTYYYSPTGADGDWTDVHADAYSFSNEIILRGRIQPAASAATHWQRY